MNRHERTRVLIGEIERILEEIESNPSVPPAEMTCPRRLYWAACEAAEAARILETHRRRAGLTPEDLEALESYRRVYERASLTLLEHFPYPHAQPPPPDSGRA